MSETVLQPQSERAASLIAVDGRNYPLESAHLSARAEGGLALSTLAQRYANPHDEPLEVLYTLPLPADGAVVGYTVRIGERVIRGEVQPRERAAEEYRRALFEGRTAGLLEQSRPDTFQQKLGNVPPRTKVEIAIDVLQPLAFVPADVVEEAEAATGNGATSNRWEYRFPTVVGVRYLGAAGRVPDAADLSPDRGDAGGIPTRFELALTVPADDGPAGGPRFSSPSHAIECAAAGDATVVRLRQQQRLDRDLVVRWTAAGAEVGVRIVEGGGLEGDGGRYALVTLVPPEMPKTTFPRDLTVLIDASGSMSGEPLALAKRVVADLLRGLGAGDRFEVLAFANDVVRLTPSLSAADERSVTRALRALEGLEAGGGTEMASAIEKALEPVRDGAQRQVVLVTDGEIGFESEVVGRIAARGNVRLHAVGVGSAPNRSLTQAAAAAGRGLEVLAGDEASAAEAARRLVAGTSRPVLANLEAGGTALTGERPSRLRDVFARQPLVFTVELEETGGSLELRGDLADGPWKTRVEVPARGSARALARTTLPIGALHGRAAIAALELRLAGHPHQLAWKMEDLVEKLAMRHRIASRRTSLVAIAEEPSVDPKAPRRRERLSVEMPAGVSAEGVGLLGGPAAGDEIPLALQYYSSAAPEVAATRGPRGLTRLWRDVRSSVSFRKDGTPPDRIEIHAIAVHRLTDDSIAVEFETPADGLEVPSGFVELWGAEDRMDAGFASCELVAGSSTRPGRVGGGVVVRLVFRIDAAFRPSPGDRLSLRWTSTEAGRGRKRSVLVNVGFVMTPSV